MLERDWLDQKPDACGECDECHRDDQPLWDTGEEAGWMFCRACCLKLLAREAKKAKI